MTAVRDWGRFVLYRGDCRELAPTLPSGIADLCIVDPPYGDTSLGWDKQCRGWPSAAAHLLKPAASIWLFGSLRYLAPVFGEMEAAGFRYSQDIVWEKQNGTGFHADRFRRVHEHAVLFYRGAWADVHHAPQYTNDATARVVRTKGRPAHTGHLDRVPYVSVDGGPRLQRSVLKIRNEHGRAIHPTQKPLELVQLLVAYSLPPGGTCVSLFAGSGTDGVATVLAGGKFIGFELDEDENGAPLGYFDAAERRIAHAWMPALTGAAV